MPRKRNRDNNGFPSGWRWMNGKIRYRVPKGCESYWDGKKQFTLGKTLNEAYRVWSERLGNTQDANTVGDLLQRYFREISSKKPPQSIKSDRRCYNELTKAFHNVPINEITALDIYRYIDKRSAKIAARREKAMLSHAYTKAIEWGYIAKHPFKGEVRLEGEKARDRYITDAEYEKILAMKPKRKKGDPIVTIQAYLRLKMLLGLRQGDMLRLSQFRGKIGDIIPITTQKTGKKIEIEVTAAVYDELKACMAIRPRDLAPWLFCNRLGKPYFSKDGEASGWQSNWQRFKKRVKDELGIDGFTEHDFRAKVGSDAPTKERAQELLTHDNVATTVRAYRRRPERLKPVK